MIPADNFYKQELKKLLSLEIDRNYKKIGNWATAEKAVESFQDMKELNRIRIMRKIQKQYNLMKEREKIKKKQEVLNKLKS